MDSEFGVSGIQFTPHLLLTTPKYYYAGRQRIGHAPGLRHDRGDFRPSDGQTSP